VSRGAGITVRLIALALVALLVTWIARNTYWDKATVPAPLRNEAATNPFYGAQHLVEELGGTSSWDRVLLDVSPQAAIVVSSWHWDLAEGRRSRMERWVEAGGRLVVDRTLVGGTEEFESWSGISRKIIPPKSQGESEESAKDDAPDGAAGDDAADDGAADDGVADDEGNEPFPVLGSDCRALHEPPSNSPPADTVAHDFEMCADWDRTHLTTTRPVAWSLHDQLGDQVLRVNVGKGSVTVVNGVPFHFRQFLQGDNAALLVAVVQLRKNDEVHFLSEEDHPSMLALMWILGWPVVLLTLALIAFALWRNGVRFGPLIAEPEQARRSLAEQIRGTGLFVIRFGGGRALHAAAVRALNEAARRRIGAYSRLSTAERIEAIARLTGADPAALGPAVNHDGPRRPHELRQAIALIEAVRRRLLHEKNA
jgi:hypothetical protein